MRRPAPIAARGVSWEAGGRRILGPLSLELLRGESLAVVGPNGAGKTTLLRLLAGLLEPSGGELLWDGVPFSRLSRRLLARRIAYVPQIRPARVPLSVEQLVLLGRYPYLSPLRLAPRQEDFAAVRRALELAGIGGLAGRRLEELSGGERQSAYIAAALAQEAEVLVLDEPTAHLDPRHQREVATIVSRLGRSGGRTVVTATHDLNFAALTAERILALKEGSVLACDRPHRILRPEVLGRLFGAPFRILPEADRPVAILELGR